LRTRPQNLAILITVIALAVALTFAASGGALARSTFQSSILPPPDSTATYTPEPVFTPVATDFATITPSAPTASPPSTFVVEATPTQPIIVEATPTVSSFLPPPTLVNPNAVVPGRLTPLAPANPPLAGPAAPPEPTPTQIPPRAPTAADLIDSGVVALSYLWLCCGALLLIATGLVVLWLWRRGKRK
jgi:cytoskeletal protein RodZ